MTTQPESVMAYVARWPCGHVQAATVDRPEHRKHVIADIRKWMLAGATIERVSVEAARTMLESCDGEKEGGVI
mgnify:CR=1 FL=1